MASLSSTPREAYPDRAKRHISETVQSEQPRKKAKVLLEEDDSSEQEQHGTYTPGRNHIDVNKTSSDHQSFTINEDFARRFEHNKRREELQKLEEKYGKTSTSVRPRNGALLEDDDTGDAGSLTDSEEEDDEGILVSEPLDAQIQSTLEAIRKKDPRVYDEKTRFFTEPEEEAQNDFSASIKNEKPMYLSDYHRRNLLDGVAATESTDIQPPSFAQQQDSLKNVIVKEMHAAGNVGDGSAPGQSDGDSDSDDFLVRASSTLQEDVRLMQARAQHQELDLETADKDPETYLSNFMSTRAWIPSDGLRFQPFESDDEEEELRAELFEEAYNLRFEDPQTSNEKLLSHARDAAAKYSVRTEPKNPRKKARDADRAKKEMVKLTREEEKARLRKLKVAEVEDKLSKIKEAAGLRGLSLRQEDWSTFLEEVWDDTRWEEVMKQRFGNEYYADQDEYDNHRQEDKGKRKIKKPRWDDDIDIDDLVPGFDAAQNQKPQFDITGDESHVSQAIVGDGLGNDDSHDRSTSRKKAIRIREKDKRKLARQERREIEHIVDRQLDVDDRLSRLNSGQFRYRETSPTAYGLTAHDILMASDSQLNQYAGLKKMAAFRDPDKKRRDKKHLGKKARLRQWRKDTFGNEKGSQKTLAEVLAGDDPASNGSTRKVLNDVNIRERKKTTRSKKSTAARSG